MIAILAERGFWAISPGRRHRDVFLASATDARGNRLRVAVSRRTGEIRRIAELGRREIWRPVRHHQD